MIDKRKKESLAILISLIGLLSSSYLLIEYYSGTISCSVLSNCDKVLNSSYAYLYGIPTSAVGVFYFLLAIIIIAFQIALHDKYLSRILKILVFIGFIFGIYLIAIQAFVLLSFCFYCLISDLSAIILYFLV
jgi:uncharacterized membrane protein